MSGKRQVRAAVFIVWVALLLLLAAAVLRTTDLGANLAKLFTQAPTVTAVHPTPTPNPVHLFTLPAAISQPHEIVAWPYGPLWLGYAGGIARVDVQATNLDNPSFTTYPVAGDVGGISTGSDGAVWFTEPRAAKIGRISANGSIQEFALPDGESGGWITSGPDGALWFGLSGGIGRMSTSGQFKEFPLTFSSPHSGVYGITAGPDGGIWFTDGGANSIVRLGLDGSEREYRVPIGAELSSVTAGPDGALWFTEGPNDVIGRVTTSGQFTEFPTPDASTNRIDQLADITVGPDKALWFTESYAHRVGRMTTDGKVTNEFSVPLGTKTVGPVSIAATGSAIWFTASQQNEIGRIDVNVAVGGGNSR